MNSYEHCSQIGRAGVEAIERLLERHYNGQRFIVTGKGFQRLGGDMIIAEERGSVRRIEVKTEERFTGNLFFEEWSNHLSTPGWGSTLSTDTLAYFFLSDARLYLLDWNKLQSWARGSNEIWRFRRVVQAKHEQLNTTTGYLLPISFLKKTFDVTEIDVKTGTIQSTKSDPMGLFDGW